MSGLIRKMAFDQSLVFGATRRMAEDDRHLEATGVAPADNAGLLIARIAISRDREAYARLFCLFAPKVKAFVMRQGMGFQAAEDLAQDTLLTVWRKAELFDPAKAGASTWIYTIARNLRIDAIRKAARVRDLPEDLWQGEPAKPADEQVIEHQVQESVSRAFDRLSEEQKTILRLSYYEGLSQAEIASAQSIPLGTVKSRMRLAIARLRTHFIET